MTLRATRHPSAVNAIEAAPRPGPAAPAVLLNAHAKRVTPRVRAAVAATVGDANVFLSRDLADADAIAARVVAAGYTTVFAAGGDGTFVGWVNRIAREAAAQGRPVPHFGILALGTGNAVAGLVGTSARTFVDDLARFVRGEATATRTIDLVDCEGRHTPFAGAGADAAVIHDYDWLRRRLRGTPLRALGTGPSGFGLAAALRSAPRHLLERLPHCEIVNAGGPAWRLGPEGARLGRPIPAGELLYAGPCMMAAASTVPFWGLGMRAFPFAGAVPGAMHLRVAGRIPVPTVLLHLPRIWTGAFRHPGLHDFHADRVTLRFDRPTPLQIGGDAEGLREAVTLGVAPEPIEVVDFS
ncbi:MAG TPA: diacylglycerol kinase family protein [Anaeromyxobacteraceae bacterium]|nr:diacylglycerol kinase family protein [Anaeromyxobacteraceae bacterium]